jgi:hypothetical protein
VRFIKETNLAREKEGFASTIIMESLVSRLMKNGIRARMDASCCFKNSSRLFFVFYDGFLPRESKILQVV